MLSRLLVVLYFIFGVPFTVARSSTSQAILCVPGQCLQGFSNVTLGETISAQGDTSVQLLPGRYTSKTTPQLLHFILTSSSATLSLSPGFNSSSVNPLPLNIALQPGIAIYSNPLFAGQAAFSGLPSAPINSSIPLPASSIALSKNVWAALTSGSTRFIFWNSIPDVSQLPPAVSLPLALVDIQSSACSPPCSSSTVCSASAKCNCPPGFTGSACESCADGFFGPNCHPCPSQCQSCDQGISGSGRCLVPTFSNAPAKCNCLNGLCGAKGDCTCNPGWTKAVNGTACAQCAPGFFLTSSGDCKICQIGCTQCADGTGDCIACKDGFSLNESDETKCSPLPAVTSSGITCPDGSYNAGKQCVICSPSCSTCNGPSSKNCIVCAPGNSLFKGGCVAVDSNGVCAGSGGMIADNNKQECDTCGAKCTSCEIPNFDVGSLASQRQCTGCLPGFFLSQGRCVGSCPSGTFVSPKDNLTCTACSSSCDTCLGSANFCLTCPNQQLASSGKCVSTCPTETFSASGACLKCHPDCRSCTGGSFEQCSACPSTRPVLSSGRCLPTCGQSEFFDLTSSSCKNCDPSCSSCSGSGSTNCLACSSSNRVLRAGSCVSANCTVSTSVIPDLGVCLSELVQVPPAPNPPNTTTTTSSTTISSSSSSSSSAQIPSSNASGPTVLVNGHQVPWWQILLAVLGGIFVLILLLILWRRRARRLRAEETVMFASARQIDGTDGWRWRLRQVKNILFGGQKGGYDFDNPPMASYGNDGVSHRHSLVGPNLNIELHSPAVGNYLDDPLISYPFPKSINRPITKSKALPTSTHRFGNRSPPRGYRSDDLSPTRKHLSDNRLPERAYRSDNRLPEGAYRSGDRPSTRRYRLDDPSPPRRHRSGDHSQTRRHRLDDPSATRRHRLDDPSPTRRHRLDDPSSTRRQHLDDPFPTRRHRLDDPSSTRRHHLDDPFPTRRHHLDDPSSTRGYHPDDRFPTRRHRLDDHSPTRGYRSDDRFPVRGYRSNDHSPTRRYRSDNHSPPREYRSDNHSPTRRYRSDNHSPPREYRPGNHSPTREYRSDHRSPSTSHRPPPKLEDRWDDRLDNSLSRYPRRNEKSGASLDFLSPPPSYPSHSEHGHASFAHVR